MGRHSVHSLELHGHVLAQAAEKHVLAPWVIPDPARYVEHHPGNDEKLVPFHLPFEHLGHRDCWASKLGTFLLDAGLDAFRQP
jgi:hypothetical protein